MYKTFLEELKKEEKENMLLLKCLLPTWSDIFVFKV